MNRILLYVSLILLIAVSVYAGTTGNLVGEIKDTETGEPLHGANVFLEDTNFGAPTGEDGKYEIYNIPAGTYNIVISFIGYKKTIIENVSILPDYTKEIDVMLEPSALEMAEVVVAGERSMLQKDETATVRVATSEEIENMPVRNYQDVIGLQAGVVQDPTKSLNFSRGSKTSREHSSGMYIRGGRGNETEFLVDGFSQRNPVTGGITTNVSSNSIESVVLTTGGFNAEYGRIMSGVVNITTKGGPKKWTGTAEMITDAVAGDWISTTSYGQNIYTLALGGPLYKENLRLFFSGEMRDMEDREPHNAVTTPFTGKLNEDGELVMEEADGKLPNNDLNGWTLQAKMNFDLTQTFKLELGALSSYDEFNEYVHWYKYNIEHAPYEENTNHSFYGKMTHILDSKTMYSLSGNYFYTERFRGDGKHQRELRDYGRQNGNPQYNDYYTLFYDSDNPSTPVGRDSLGNVINDEGHIYGFRLQESSYYGGDFQMTTQRWDGHEVKMGFDIKRHTFRYFRHVRPENMWVKSIDENGDYVFSTNFDIDIQNYGYDLDKEALKKGEVKIINLDEGYNKAKHPLAWSTFLQDKLTWNNLVFNFGIRYDYFNSGSQQFKNFDKPLGDDNPDTPQDESTSLEEADLEDAETYHKFSPRLGLSFPVTDKLFFHVSYGKFFQQPNLQDLYTDFDYFEYSMQPAQSYYIGIGNPNLEPEETTAYEVGIARQIGNNLRFDVKAYYKDITGLTQETTISAYPKAYGTFINKDFATVKGFDFTLKLRRTNHLAVDVGYTLAYASGTGSMSGSQHNISWQGTEEPRSTYPLDFDQRHKVNVTLDYRYGNNEGPKWGTMQPFENAGINMIFTAGSGLPYTAVNPFMETTISNLSVQPIVPLNHANRDWTFNIDTKISKGFKLPYGEFGVYVWIQNLLNTKNYVRVYESSGSGETTTWLSTREGKTTAEQNGEDFVEKFLDSEKDPTYMGTPRIVKLGLKYSF